MSEEVVLEGQIVEASSLTDIERKQLDRQEQVIERGLSTFFEVGAALLDIRDRRLYRATHDTFEAYCEDRWEISRQRAHNGIDAVRVLETINVNHGLQRSFTERQARELAPLLADPDELRDVWREANERADGKVTAAFIREIRKEREQPTDGGHSPAFDTAAVIREIFNLTDLAGDQAETLTTVRLRKHADQLPNWSSYLARNISNLQALLERIKEVKS